MSRVSNAAAVTLQTWSRTVIAKKEASSLRYEKYMQQMTLKSLDSSENMPMEVLARRFLMVAACIALVGVTTQTTGGPQMLASSPAAQDTVGTTRIFQVIAGALPSLLHSTRN